MNPISQKKDNSPEQRGEPSSLFSLLKEENSSFDSFCMQLMNTFPLIDSRMKNVLSLFFDLMKKRAPLYINDTKEEKEDKAQLIHELHHLLLEQTNEEEKLHLFLSSLTLFLSLIHQGNQKDPRAVYQALKENQSINQLPFWSRLSVFEQEHMDLLFRFTAPLETLLFLEATPYEICTISAIWQNHPPLLKQAVLISLLHLLGKNPQNFCELIKNTLILLRAFEKTHNAVDLFRAYVKDVCGTLQTREFDEDTKFVLFRLFILTRQKPSFFPLLEETFYALSPIERLQIKDFLKPSFSSPRIVSLSCFLFVMAKKNQTLQGMKPFLETVANIAFIVKRDSSLNQQIAVSIDPLLSFVEENILTRKMPLRYLIDNQCIVFEE